jgi:hypothetical protein
MTAGLFLHPVLYHIDWVSTPWRRHCKALGKRISFRRAFFDLLIPWHIGTVLDLAAYLSCSQIIDPSLGAGGDRVVPDVRRDSNGSALTVVHGQDAVGIHPCCISSIVTYL